MNANNRGDRTTFFCLRVMPIVSPWDVFRRPGLPRARAASSWRRSAVSLTLRRAPQPINKQTNGRSLIDKRTAFAVQHRGLAAVARHLVCRGSRTASPRGCRGVQAKQAGDCQGKVWSAPFRIHGTQIQCCLWAVGKGPEDCEAGGADLARTVLYAPVQNQRKRELHWGCMAVAPSQFEAEGHAEQTG